MSESTTLEQRMERLPMFVYGTLREGYGNDRLFHRPVANVQHQTALLMGYDMYAAGIPFIYPSVDENAIVTGELVTVSDETYQEMMEKVDALEGYNVYSDSGWYMRRRVTVVIGDGEQVEAWAYIAQEQPTCRIVPSGDYATVRGRSRR